MSQQNEASQIPAQIGLLNLRINDMMAQLNSVLKRIVDENAALKKENSDLKAENEKMGKS